MSTLIDRTLWAAMIEQNLFDDAALQAVKAGLRDDSAYKNAATVAIPNAGAAAPVTVGNNVYPIPVQQRTDNVKTYNLTNLEVGPVVVQYKEQMPLSYDKQESILQDELNGIGERAAREILLGHYSKTQEYVQTSGADTPGHAPGATGNRKSLTFADVRSAVAKISKQNVPGQLGLFLDTSMYFQLLGDLQKDGNYNFPEYAPGFTLPGMNGVNVYMLTNVLYAATGRDIRAIGHAGATTDKAVALLVSRAATSFAIDDIQAFVNESDPTYMGNIYSMSTWLGGSYRRLDEKGVIPIIQQ